MEISASAFGSGIGALQVGQRRLDQAAADIAGGAVVPAPAQQPNAAPQADAGNRPDLAQSLVELRIGQNEARAGAKLVQTADEVLGTLIDTSA